MRSKKKDFIDQQIDFDLFFEDKRPASESEMDECVCDPWHGEGTWDQFARLLPGLVFKPDF